MHNMSLAQGKKIRDAFIEGRFGLKHHQVQLTKFENSSTFCYLRIMYNNVKLTRLALIVCLRFSVCQEGVLCISTAMP